MVLSFQVDAVLTLLVAWKRMLLNIIVKISILEHDTVEQYYWMLFIKQEYLYICTIGVTYLYDCRYISGRFVLRKIFLAGLKISRLLHRARWYFTA